MYTVGYPRKGKDVGKEEYNQNSLNKILKEIIKIEKNNKDKNQTKRSRLNVSNCYELIHILNHLNTIILFQANLKVTNFSIIYIYVL